MRRGFLYFLLCVTILFIACNAVPNSVQQVLDRSENNKNELEKVIDHYRKQNNKLKLKAAYFLITNLPYHYHYEGKGVENYKKLFSIITGVPNERKKYLNSIWDSLTNQFGEKFPGPAH